MPTVLMMLFTSMYGVVDGLYVNNYVGKHAFAAVTLITPLPLLIGAFAYMIGGGGAAIIAQELARGEKKKAGRYFTSLTCVSNAPISQTRCPSCCRTPFGKRYTSSVFTAQPSLQPTICLPEDAPMSIAR